MLCIAAITITVAGNLHWVKSIANAEQPQPAERQYTVFGDMRRKSGSSMCSAIFQQPTNRMFVGEVSEAGCRIDLGCVTSHNPDQNTRTADFRSLELNTVYCPSVFLAILLFLHGNNQAEILSAITFMIDNGKQM